MGRPKKTPGEQHQRRIGKRQSGGKKVIRTEVFLDTDETLDVGENSGQGGNLGGWKNL